MHQTFTKKIKSLKHGELLYESDKKKDLPHLIIPVLIRYLHVNLFFSLAKEVKLNWVYQHLVPPNFSFLQSLA